MRKKIILKVVSSALLASILFAQEELLTFIPNIQLTVLLLVLYGAYCGPKWGSLIVLIHVLLDNLLIGSFVPYVVIPMLIGWEITMLLGYFVRKKSIFIKALIGGIGALVYSYIFLFVNVIFLKIDFYAYLISDIVFEIILISCSVITILWLFNPLYKALMRNNVFEIDNNIE